MAIGSSMRTHIHRHIGGLEIRLVAFLNPLHIHRHIGGLENHEITQLSTFLIHRHIGGLENLHQHSNR